MTLVSWVWNFTPFLLEMLGLMQPLKTNRENDFYSRADGRLSEFGTNEEPLFWLSVSCQCEELGATFQTVKSIWPNTKKVLLFSTYYKVGTKSFTVIAFKWRCRSIGSKKTFYSTKSCSSNHPVPGFFFPASFSLFSSLQYSWQ